MIKVIVILAIIGALAYFIQTEKFKAWVSSRTKVLNYVMGAIQAATAAIWSGVIQVIPVIDTFEWSVFFDKQVTALIALGTSIIWTLTGNNLRNKTDSEPR